MLCIALALACSPQPAKAPPASTPGRIERFSGQIFQPNGKALDYRVVLARDPRERGTYLGTIDIPLQALAGASLQAVDYTPNERLEFELALAGTPRWVGVFDASGAIHCTFSQGSNVLPCSMVRGGEAAASSPSLSGH